MVVLLCDCDDVEYVCGVDGMNYNLRGKCKEMAEELSLADNYRLVRGYYYEPLWDREEHHWWCEDSDGNIIDHTKEQFPSGGIVGFYREFSGYYTCETCGCDIKEDKVIQMGNYTCCSHSCAMRLVGL